MSLAEWLVSAIVFLPVVWAMPLLAFPAERRQAMLVYALAGAAVTLGLSVWLTVHVLAAPSVVADSAATGLANVSPWLVLTKIEWIRTWNIHYAVGLDGISLPLVLLTALVSVLSLAASWGIEKHLKGFLILMLTLETGLLGVFVALDFFLFYVFWEVVLLPMYFLIGIWGGPRREYAAMKFFIYTLAGSVLMLVPMLMFYFASGGSFDMIELARLAETGDARALSPHLQTVAFALLFVAFAIKLPIFPFHTWLPDAHVEAPTPVSMMLAGVLLKMGGYGLIRVAYPMCPYGAQAAGEFLMVLAIINIVYGALVALGQTDFKRLVAYSSVSHMGYVLLGLAAWRVDPETGISTGKQFWEMGVSAAVFQMVSHGLTSTGMFFLVGVLYDRVHHRNLNQFGGMTGIMPHYSGLAAVIFFAALGLPGLCGFIGEVFAVLAAFHYSPAMAVIAAFGIVLTAAYILWMIQRVYLGDRYTGPNGEGLKPLSWSEGSIAYVVVILAIVLGVYPEILFGTMRASVTAVVNQVDAGYRAAHEVVARGDRLPDARSPLLSPQPAPQPQPAQPEPTQ